MPKKHYDLPEQTIKVIEKTMNETGLKYEVDAVIFMINEYEKQRNSINELVARATEFFQSDLIGIKKSMRSSEEYSTILLDIANTWLLTEHDSGADKWTELYLNDGGMCHDLISIGKNRIASRLSKQKQLKDNEKLQRGE